jgi:hypothetical protein
MASKRETRKYQDKITKLLSKIFGESSVDKEWDVAKNSQDEFTRNLYCPRIDIAVGPFNKTRDVEINIEGINNAHKQFRSFIGGLNMISEVRLKACNENPRCFIAIEIEKRGTRKHMLGDIINASSIGKIGIIVPWDDKARNAFERIKRYLDFIKTVKKTSYSPKNLLIVRRNKLKQFLENFISETTKGREKQKLIHKKLVS